MTKNLAIKLGFSLLTTSWFVIHSNSKCSPCDFIPYTMNQHRITFILSRFTSETKTMQNAPVIHIIL